MKSQSDALQSHKEALAKMEREKVQQETHQVQSPLICCLIYNYVPDTHTARIVWTLELQSLILPNQLHNSAPRTV